ncbi:MAG: DUF1573 domain-containing protein [Bacteroidota bacterium]
MKKFMLLIVALAFGLVSAVAQDQAKADDLKFESKSYDFGTVMQNEKVEHTFPFENASGHTIVITNVRTTCGCTVPEWPREPIASGEASEIGAVFNTRGKRNYQRKVITINYTVKGKDGEEDQQKTSTVSLVGTVKVPEPASGN